MLSSLKKRFGRDRQVTEIAPKPSQVLRESPKVVLTPEEKTTSTGGAVGANSSSTHSGCLGGKSRPEGGETALKLEVPTSDHHSRRLRQQPNSSSSVPVSPADEITPDGAGRPRGYSDASASSYHTCRGESKSSLVQKPSPTFSRPVTPNTPESLPELLHSMKEVFEEKMGGLEQKIDAMHSSLESRVAAIEKRLNIESGDQQSVSVAGIGRDGEHLSVLVEVFYYAHTYMNQRV